MIQDFDLTETNAYDIRMLPELTETDSVCCLLTEFIYPSRCDGNFLSDRVLSFLCQLNIANQ